MDCSWSKQVMVKMLKSNSNDTMYEKVNFDRTIIPFYFLILELKFGWKYLKSNWRLKEICYLKLNKIQVGKYFAVFNFSLILRSNINCSHVLYEQH